MIYVVDGDDTSSVRSRSTTRSAPNREQRSTQLHAAGMRVVMITGDAQQVADAIAAELGIDEVFAEVLPADKEPPSSSSKHAACGSRWSATV